MNSFLNAISWKAEEDHYSSPVNASPEEVEVLQDTLDGLRQIHADMNQRLEQSQNQEVQGFKDRICNTLSDVETDIGKAIQEAKGGAIDQDNNAPNPYMRQVPDNEVPQTSPVDKKLQVPQKKPVAPAPKQVPEKKPLETPAEPIQEKKPVPEIKGKPIRSALVDLPYKVEPDIPENHKPSGIKLKKKAGKVVDEIIQKTKVPKPKGLKAEDEITRGETTKIIKKTKIPEPKNWNAATVVYEDDGDSRLKVVKIGDKQVVLRDETMMEEEDPIQDVEDRQPQTEQGEIPAPEGVSVKSFLVKSNYDATPYAKPQRELVNVQTNALLKTRKH